MKPIESYCRTQVDGWDRISLLPEQLSFITRRGINLATDIKDLGALKVIHVSLAPLMSMPGHPTVEELFYETPQILQEFFGDRGFAMQPIDERNPHQRHYFSILKEDEE